MAIRTVNWGEVTGAVPTWRPAGWRLWAIWPSPVDHDLCFKEAGFDDFADSGADWDADFARVVEDVLDALARSGAAQLVSGEPPLERKRARESIRDALMAAAMDDNFAPCTVLFGEPASGMLRTSDGHPILWVSLLGGGAEQVRARLGARHTLQERTLRWSGLL